MATCPCILVRLLVTGHALLLQPRTLLSWLKVCMQTGLWVMARFMFPQKGTITVREPVLTRLLYTFAVVNVM